jgi:hypothetical protein
MLYSGFITVWWMPHGMETCVCVYFGGVANEVYPSQSRLKATGHRVSCYFIVTLKHMRHVRPRSHSCRGFGQLDCKRFPRSTLIAHQSVLQIFVVRRTITCVSRELILRGSFVCEIDYGAWQVHLVGDAFRLRVSV